MFFPFVFKQNSHPYCNFSDEKAYSTGQPEPQEAWFMSVRDLKKDNSALESVLGFQGKKQSIVYIGI